MFSEYRQICSDYHGGQSTQMYMVSCSGECNDLSALECEVEYDIRYHESKNVDEWNENHITKDYYDVLDGLNALLEEIQFQSLEDD